MRILWFEVSTPQKYESSERVVLGWQDALESLVCKTDNVELIIAFENKNNDTEPRIVDGITYVPIPIRYSLFDKIRMRYYTWDSHVGRLLPGMKRVVEHYRPDLIHVWGTEWPWGLIAEHTDIPVLIHIQGSIVPYNNALYPPGYNVYDRCKSNPYWTPWRLISIWLDAYKSKSRQRMEERIWKAVRFYMGRTQWDKMLSSVMHPGRTYFHVEEALRPQFLQSGHLYKPSSIKEKKLRLISIGCSSFWKGPDMLLKTAKVLTGLNVDFEWLVVGQMPQALQRTVERHEHSTFAENHVKFLGFTPPEKLIDLLCNSTMYVHTAYIENSPNAICEAQYLGVPIVSTNVGGIASLVHQDEDGVLVPANDPWQMAGAIQELANDVERQKVYSANGRKAAMLRHGENHILSQLLDCYSQVMRIKGYTNCQIKENP